MSLVSIQMGGQQGVVLEKAPAPKGREDEGVGLLYAFIPKKFPKNEGLIQAFALVRIQRVVFCILMVICMGSVSLMTTFGTGGGGMGLVL